MNRIEQIIAQLCPNGVEYKKLWEITNWDRKFNGVDNSKQKIVLKFKHVLANELKNMALPFGNVKLLSTGNFEGYTTEEVAGDAINEGEVIAIPSGGSSNIKYYKGKFVDGGNILASTSNPEVLNLKFLYYFLLNNNNVISNYYRGSGIKHPDMSAILDFPIPIPPLPVQEEIVRILDKFTTGLEAELEAELEARKKQYEYYRNRLLTPVEVGGKWLLNGQPVEWKKLGEVCLQTGNIKWKESNKTYKYIDLSSVDRENHIITETTEINYENAPNRAQKIVLKNDVLFATTRPTLMRYTIIGDEYDNQIASTGYCILRANKQYVLPKWIYYNLSTYNFYKFVEINQEGTAYPSISDIKVKNFVIPIPPLSEQERIVSILDKFDALINDILQGLPAEIEARRKQYEYYRNKLLSFKKIE